MSTFRLIHHEGQFVASSADDSISTVVEQLFELLPASEFAADMKALLKHSAGPRVCGEFCDHDDKLIGRYGLIFLDPLDPTLKKLAAPLYAKAARQAHDIATAIEQRSRELESDGYHAQVLASANSFPLFLHEADGSRKALARVDNGKYKTKDSEREYTAEELAELALQSPERFSPNVTLRAVVQDYLLPTIAYYGGAAEIAYFAQTAEVYRVLGRPATPILPRSSLT